MKKLILLMLVILIEQTENSQAENKSKIKTTPNFSIIHNGAGLSLHKEMFIMPVSWSDKFHGDKTEMVFHLSAKYSIYKTIYAGYTQKSFWQAYNNKESAPFRETNYNPEMFYRLPSNTFLGPLGIDFGFEHESNGRSQPISRSWNRLYLSPFLPLGCGLTYLKFWYRLPEDKGDDNPDILNFLGYGELNYDHQFFDTHRLHLMARGNVKTRKGCVSINYSLPLFSPSAFFLIRFWNGYGESLIDYNNSIMRVGCGIMFAR